MYNNSKEIVIQDVAKRPYVEFCVDEIVPVCTRYLAGGFVCRLFDNEFKSRWEKSQVGDGKERSERLIRKLVKMVSFIYFPRRRIDILTFPCFRKKLSRKQVLDWCMEFHEFLTGTWKNRILILKQDQKTAVKQDRGIHQLPSMCSFMVFLTKLGNFKRHF